MRTLGRVDGEQCVWAASSEAGSRPCNEDLVYADPTRGLYLVCDGRGGRGRGDRASAVIRDLIAEHADPLQALHQANEHVCELSGQPDHQGMGATVALARVTGDRLDLYWVGEVRGYLARNGELSPLTEDHTLAAQLVRTKQLAPEKALSHPTRKRVMRFVGMDAPFKVDHVESILLPGDTLILCTDGFYTELPEATLLALGAAPEARSGLEQAMAQVRAGASEDNFSAMVIRYQPSEGARGLDAYQHFTEHLAGELDLDRILRFVLDQMVELSTADRGFIALLDPEGSPSCLITTETGSDSDLFPHSRTIIGQVMARKQSLWIEDAQADALLAGSRSLVDLDLRMVAALPLKIGSELVGLVYLDRKTVSPDFSRSLLSFLEGLAAFATLAVHNARIQQDATARVQKLQLINEVSLAINATLESDQLLSRILMHSLSLTGGEHGYLLLGDGPDLTCLASLDNEGRPLDQLEISRSIVTRCTEEERAICIMDTHADSANQTTSVMALDLRSVICVPLMANRKRVGVLYISSRAISKTFTAQDQSLLEAIANQAALTIRNAQLLKEQEKQILELERALELVNEAQTKAVTDGLTGLYNHVYFKEQLYNSVLEADRYGHALSVILVDLDHFKKVNDTYGHQTGDEVLRQASMALRKHVRDCDVLARYGGEELAILLPQTDLPGAMVVAGRVRAAIELLEVTSLEGELVTFTASLGVSAHRPGLTTVELLERADKALYAAKRGGRNRVCADGQTEATPLPGGEVIEAQQQTFINTVAALSEAVNVRDRYTSDHAALVERLAHHVGMAMGLDGRRLKELELAAVLHDVGKLGIPDSILQKAGDLDPQEWSMMRTHPVHGSRILKAGNLPNVAQIIAGHHERWDGSGYPEGLKGEEIHQAARIVAVLDAYCAMTTDRPYRPAFSHTEAVQEIGRSAGTQFDPQVVRIFLEVIDQAIQDHA